MTVMRPGETARHRDHGIGLVSRDPENGRTVIVYHPYGNVRNGYDETHDLDGWERAESVEPGFVQVDVRDVKVAEARAWSRGMLFLGNPRILIRVADALAERLLVELDRVPPTARYAGQITDGDDTTRTVNHRDQGDNER